TLLVSRNYTCVLLCSQAEDGIRDTSVTGVQTCALPISHTHTHTHTLQEVRHLHHCKHTHTHTSGSPSPSPLQTHTHTHFRKSITNIDIGNVISTHNFTHQFPFSLCCSNKPVLVPAFQYGVPTHTHTHTTPHTHTHTHAHAHTAPPTHTHTPQPRMRRPTRTHTQTHAQSSRKSNVCLHCA